MANLNLNHVVLTGLSAVVPSAKRINIKSPYFPSEEAVKCTAITGVAEIEVEQVDYAIFHQANLMMNEMIRKKLKLPKEKVPYSLKLYGDTSSASIPLTMVTELKEQLSSGKNRLLFCGFGVGLSWGTCYMETNDLHILDLIEV